MNNSLGRFLSRRDKSGEHRRSKSSDTSRKETHRKPRPHSADILLLFKNEAAARERDEAKAEAKKVQALRKRFEDINVHSLRDDQLENALRTTYASGDVDKAFEISRLFLESQEGIVKSYNPDVHMQGAENRNAVTCYLDSLLFAMFARLGSFEPILHKHFDDEPRRRLATLIRLWVNMLRTGKLIHVDITKHLQDALAACGWEEAAEVRQQDTSEAFGFITEKLELPLLTLKMDIYHTGAEVAADDHKFIHERLLEVAVPADPGDGKSIKLEDCLEDYFNNRIEVVRRLERSNTMSSEKRPPSPILEQPVLQHVEISEISQSAPTSPLTQTPATEVSPTQFPGGPRRRATSIIRHRVIDEANGESSTSPGTHSHRKGSLRKEVLMPAWQFFSLIPWYTEKVPTTDAQVAAHFTSTRPVLGVCLKRYSMTMDGTPTRRNTFIDIPLQIALPHFIQDDQGAGNGPLFGNFKLSLQSVVCHRGSSVHAGHYISLVRSTVQNYEDDPSSGRHSGGPPRYSEDKWIMFDDLASKRVQYVDIGEALKKEMPYLLFYQVQPLLDVVPETPSSEAGPPAYSGTPKDVAISHSALESPHPSQPHQEPGYFDNIPKEQEQDTESKERLSVSDTDQPRFSLNLTGADGRESLALTDTSLGSAATAPPTPSEESSSGPSRVTSRFTLTSSRSRPTSQKGENRIREVVSRLTLRKSKDSINKHLDGFTTLSTAASSSDGTTALDVTSTTSSSMGLVGSTSSISEDPSTSVSQVDDVAPTPTPKKRGKDTEKRRSSQDAGKEHHSHHLHGLKSRTGTGGKDDGLDRECIVM